MCSYFEFFTFFAIFLHLFDLKNKYVKQYNKKSTFMYKDINGIFEWKEEGKQQIEKDKKIIKN